MAPTVLGRPAVQRAGPRCPLSRVADGVPEDEQFAWAFWTLDWGTPAPGEHAVTSWATAVDGEVQPAPDDPFLAAKKTYWESSGQIIRRVRIG